MTHHEKTPTDPLTAVEEAQEVTLKKERSAGRWVVISRATIVAVVLAFLLFGVYLAFTNIQLRAELSEASDRLAESHAEASALYQQLLAVGESPVVEPSEPDTHGTIGPQGAPGDRGPAGEPYPTGYAMISWWGSFSPTVSVDDSVFREVKVCVPQ